MAKLLIAAGADPNIKLEGMASPLSAVVRVYHEVRDEIKQNMRAVAEVLIDAGADLNVGGDGNWAKTTPLIVATRAMFLEGMQLLLERGADPTIEAGGQTAMSVAEAIKSKEVAKQAVALLKEHEVS